MARARASTTSGLSARTADDTTTTSAPCDVGGGMSDLHRHAQRGQPVGVVRPLLVRPRHHVAEVRQQFGDAAHADATHPHEVHVPRPSEHVTAPRQRFDAIDDPGRGVGPAEAAGGRCHPLAPRLVARQPQHHRRQPLAGQLALVDHLGGAGTGQRRGVLALMVVGGRRQRHQHHRPAEDGQLGQRRGAGARHHQVGCRHLRRHVVEERQDGRRSGRRRRSRRAPAPAHARRPGA